MAHGSDLVRLAETRIGEKYVWGANAPKDDPNWKGPWDCAEFTSWLVYQTTQRLYGCRPLNKPSSANAYTGYWGDDAKTFGKIVSIERAIQTPGAFLLRLPNRNRRPASGHVVLTDGNGGTIEAMGTAFGVRRGKTHGRLWDLGILVPWISYDGAANLPTEPTEPPPSAHVVILRRGKPMVEDPRVEALQKALLAAGFDPGPIDGLFGPLTEAAVFEFQSAKNLTVDGEVGPETGGALGLPYWQNTPTLPPHEQPAEPQPIPPPAADWPIDTRPVLPSVDLDRIRGEYDQMWDTMAIRDSKLPEVRRMATAIANGRNRYESVASHFGSLPWYVVGTLHALECSCNFQEHLHNGDPLISRTVHVPKNRPPIWTPQSTWEESARDAIEIEGLGRPRNWDLPEILYAFERYNGFGPRRRFGVATAYLWSFSNHYVRGKYIGDGVWDPDAVSKQAGAAVLLKYLVSSNVIVEPSHG
ncbi:MAG: peptidoglycan-binding protein [Pseudolabrys sp.]